MSEFKEIRGVKFRVKAFSNMAFNEFKQIFEKQVPYKRLKQRDREPALREDFQKLTGKPPAEKKQKSKKADSVENSYISESELRKE